MKLLFHQSLLEQLLSTATSLTTKITRHMTPHHKGLPPTPEAAAAAAEVDVIDGYKIRFCNRVNAYR